MRVYHFLIECLLKYIVIQIRKSSQENHLMLTSFHWNYSIFLLFNYISVSWFMNLFSTSLLLLLMPCVIFLDLVLLNFFHSVPHSKVSTALFKGNSLTINVLAFAFNWVYKKNCFWKKGWETHIAISSFFYLSFLNFSLKKKAFHSADFFQTWKGPFLKCSKLLHFSL